MYWEDVYKTFIALRDQLYRCKTQITKWSWQLPSWMESRVFGYNFEREPYQTYKIYLDKVALDIFHKKILKCKQITHL